MGGKEEVMEILKSNDLTASEIESELDMSLESVKTYLQRLKKEKMIKPTTKRGREIVWSTESGEVNGNFKEAVELLKFYNDMFKKNYKALIEIKPIVEKVKKNKDKFNRIEELVNFV